MQYSLNIYIFTLSYFEYCSIKRPMNKAVSLWIASIFLLPLSTNQLHRRSTFCGFFFQKCLSLPNLQYCSHRSSTGHDKRSQPRCTASTAMVPFFLPGHGPQFNCYGWSHVILAHRKSSKCSSTPEAQPLLQPQEKQASCCHPESYYRGVHEVSPVLIDTSIERYGLCTFILVQWDVL